MVASIMNIYDGVLKKCLRILAAVICAASIMGNMQVLAANNDKEVSEEIQINAKGATIWPIQDIVMYNADKKEIKTIPAGMPLRVWGQDDTYFKIYYAGKIGYIQSSFCMINLPDIMQEQMQYDITNSYGSIYKIHGEPIEAVTGEILYPNVKIGEDQYLVPLLYPVALKLYEAEEEALSLGYTLKVYDAYRPYEVTKDIYSRTTEFVEQNPIYAEYMNETVNGVTYSQSNFLAKAVSNHNYGVAVDITLSDLETGEELNMQSAMHELSAWSVLDLNNSEAELLADIMLEKGFTGLKSEWWHFEIREYRQEYAAFQIEPYKQNKTAG